MGVWYIMMSISMYMSCVFQWFLVFSDLWQPRSGPVFFPLSSARRCVWSALLEQLFQAAHTNIHAIFFMSVHHPKLLGTNVDRNFGALRSQAWRDCIFQLVPRSINRACMHVDALLAPIKSQAICPVEFAFAVVDTAVQTTKGRSYFWIARCAITAKQRLVPSVGCRNRIASSCLWYFRKTFWRRLAVPLCSCNTNVPKNELATSLFAGRIAFDHTEPLMIMQQPPDCQCRTDVPSASMMPRSCMSLCILTATAASCFNKTCTRRSNAPPEEAETPSCFPSMSVVGWLVFRNHKDTAFQTCANASRTTTRKLKLKTSFHPVGHGARVEKDFFVNGGLYYEKTRSCLWWGCC